ncbi:hypothetical protein GE09DRAFT_719533 [Coniochaeta sp. 2T2.1]|nr:hypothetical protein GE09DRAFT_719533 [Coniochaeta sp. 2T2.1]
MVDQSSFARSVPAQGRGSNAEHTQGLQSHDMLRNSHNPIAAPGPSGMATTAQVAGGMNAQPEGAQAQSSNNRDYMTYGNIGGSDAGLAQDSVSASEIGLGQGSLFDSLGGQGGSAEAAPFGPYPREGLPEGRVQFKSPKTRRYMVLGLVTHCPGPGTTASPKIIHWHVGPAPQTASSLALTTCGRLLPRWRSVGRHCRIDHRCSSKHISDIDRAESYGCSHGDCDYRALYRPNIISHCKHRHSCSIKHA